MSAPVKPLLAIGAAFAAGVAVTAALVDTKPDGARVDAGAHQAPSQVMSAPEPGKAAALSPPSQESADASASKAGSSARTASWVDPVKPQTSPPEARSSLPPLVFHLEPEPAKAGPSQESRRARDGTPASSVAALVSPPRRPDDAELIAKLEDKPRPIVRARTTDRTLLSRSLSEARADRSRNVGIAATGHRSAEPSRVASVVERSNDAVVVATDSPRREPAPRRVDGAAAQPPVAARRFRYAARDGNAFDDAPSPYRQRTNPAGSSGVMRWLEQP